MHVYFYFKYFKFLKNDVLHYMKKLDHYRIINFYGVGFGIKMTSQINLILYTLRKFKIVHHKNVFVRHILKNPHIILVAIQ